MTISFTRNPSTKIPVTILPGGQVSALNTLILIGHMAASGSVATANTPLAIANYGDPVAALAECVAAFGAGAELTGMVVAAINANGQSGDQNIVFPPIVVIPMASADAGLAALLAANVGYPMPFVASSYPGSSSKTADLITHLLAISSADRGLNGQFGSFGFVATDEALSPATAEGIAAACPNLLMPWLRDAAHVNPTANIAAALAARAAANGAPFLPMDDLVVGGLLPPTATSDYHTGGDAGTVALGLAAGLVPLSVDNAGKIRISRMVTTSRRIVGVADASYYDMIDFQKLYYYRLNAWVLCQDPQYKRALASDDKLRALKSDLLKLAHDFQDQGMFQYVEDLASQWTVIRVPGNRNAAIYTVPVNVVPGFENKGIDLQGTTQFDSFVVGG